MTSQVTNQVTNQVTSQAALTRSQLSLELGCNASDQTVLQKRYMAYPLSVSPLFRREDNSLEKARSKRAYLYRMNTSPGLLAEDALGIEIQLAPGSQLYLADQSATKVHQMPDLDTHATVKYDIKLEADSTLEFLPEPLILFENSDLQQTTNITMHREAGLCWGEIVLPGRLARGEVYQFRKYLNKTRIQFPNDKPWFAETINLTGKGNRFVQSPLFASDPVLGTLILVLPEAIATTTTLKALSDQIDQIGQTAAKAASISLASSILPGNRGLFVRAMSATTREIQLCFRQALNSVRSLRGQNPLPYGL